MFGFSLCGHRKWLGRGTGKRQDPDANVRTFVRIELDVRGSGACTLYAVVASEQGAHARGVLRRCNGTTWLDAARLPMPMQGGLCAVSDKSRSSMEEGAEDENPCAGCPTLRERNRERLRPAMARYAAWKAAISAAADWRETVAAGASGAS